MYMYTNTHTLALCPTHTRHNENGLKMITIRQQKSKHHHQDATKSPTANKDTMLLSKHTYIMI